MTIPDTIRIGTRKSKLAMWQAEHVQTLLNNRGIKTELVPIETKGDKILNVSIAKIGSKGVFTEELEYLLETGQIQMAIHSAKDLPSELPNKFEILAFTKREKANDVLISHKEGVSLNDASLVIGTSSTRRIATLKHYFPEVKTVEVRGNLQTRIKKMEEGLCDALLLAYAGVARMEYTHMIRQELDMDWFTPAVGQGSLAVEVSVDMAEEVKSVLKEILNDPETESGLLAERAYLKRLKGGCSIPAFAHATVKGKDIEISGGIFSLDGKELIRKHLSGQATESEELGSKLGEEVLGSGGDQILKKIKETLNK